MSSRPPCRPVRRRRPSGRPITRAAPPAALPAGAPGLVFAACCVLMGGSVVALPGGVDTVWALVTCYLVTALAWLLYRARGEGLVPAAEAAALAALGLLLLAVRI